MEKEERRNRKILTDNRLSTINKRETSFEGITSMLENGEDGIYNLISEDKNIIFRPKVTITEEDLATIPFLQQLRDTINLWEQKIKTVSGKSAYIIKNALIEMRKDQYLIKDAYRQPIQRKKINNLSSAYIALEDKSYIDSNNEVVVAGVSLMDQKCVSTVLCNYGRLRGDSEGRFLADTWYFMEDFDNISSKALEPHPIYERIVEYKIDKIQNIEIQQKIQEEFGIKYSIEYISSLWRNKIPKLIAAEAKKDFITFHFKKNKLPFKRCSKCGQLKPAHNMFFSRNNSTESGWYSICKDCRNKRGK